MRGAILLLLSVCVAFGASADPQGLSSSIDQGKAVANALKGLPPSGLVTASPLAQQVLLAQAEPPQSDVCAIPLIEVQVDQNMAKMPKLRLPEGVKMPTVQVPAPSCK